LLTKKRRTLYHHVRTAEIFRKNKDTLVNHKSSEEENSTAMSGEDLKCQVISSKIIRAYCERFKALKDFSYFNKYILI
jgi:hypothetical protein